MAHLIHLEPFPAATEPQLISAKRTRQLTEIKHSDSPLRTQSEPGHSPFEPRHSPFEPGHEPNEPNQSLAPLIQSLNKINLPNLRKPRNNGHGVPSTYERPRLDL